MKLSFLPDEPITSINEDLLGFRDFVELVNNSIQNTQTPFVYGVLGDWGTGKTSILRLLENAFKNDLLKDPQPGKGCYIPIWFNAWQYENETNVIYPILSVIKKSYYQQLIIKDKVRDFGKVFLQVVKTSVLALTDIGLRAGTKALTGEAFKLEEVQKNLDSVRNPSPQWEKPFQDWADSVEQLHKAFEGLLGSYAADYANEHKGIKKEDIRFVIIIDDLDRCLPDATIAILESIKNYLAVKNSIFVLGLNARVVYQGINHKYQGISIDGREYLEKILNYTFYVPEPVKSNVREFVNGWIDKLASLSLSVNEKADLKDQFTIFGNVMEECRFNNPRRIKRIVNRFSLFLDTHERTLSDYKIPNIVKLITIAEYYPAIYRLLLVNNPLPVISDIKVLIEGKQGKSLPKDYFASYDLNISDILPQMKVMQKLFDMQEQTVGTKPDLYQQVQEVYRLTRLV